MEINSRTREKMPYKITRKLPLNEDVFFMEVEAPKIANNFTPGNFIVIMPVKKGERIPMSVQKVEDGRIACFIKGVGKTTLQLKENFQVGDSLDAVLGPLGTPPEVKEFGNVVFCSDGVCGHAENYDLSHALNEIDGNHVISIQTFESEDTLYPEEYLTKDVCDEHYLTTKDGSTGIEGHYLDVIKDIIEEKDIDKVFAGGEMISSYKLSRLTAKQEIPTMVTVHQIMVDGTGMCGACRVFVDGEMKLTCVDGPMFDAQDLDFRNIMRSLGKFREKEKEAMKYWEEDQ